MISGFKDFLQKEQSTVYCTFGRMNPPTMGHQKVLDRLSEEAGKNPYFIFLSHSHDNKNNPLTYSEKIKYARKMFPKHSRKILVSDDVRNVLDVANEMYAKEFKKLVMVVGEDREIEIDILLNKYNGKKTRSGFYNFESIEVISAGERDSSLGGVEGISSSSVRKSVSENNFIEFSQQLPLECTNADAQMLFNDLRRNMGMKEEKSFKKRVSFKPVSEEREKYVKGKLFQVGDSVRLIESGVEAVVKHLGSNYVIVEHNGESTRKWLTDVVKVEQTKVAQDPDIKDREGSQPASYHAGLSKGTKEKRDAQFKKQAKMSDSNPKAYKPAPGDKTAKTKPSKYTKAFKDMYGEEIDPMTRVKNTINKEKEQDKIKHDRMLDRARLKATRITNKGVGTNEKDRRKNKPK